MTRADGAAAAARRVLWRAVLALTGGLRVDGANGLPPGPCVIVANHNSHADTAALIAALSARRQPAADYWFRGGIRPAICRALCAAFPVRRSAGGTALFIPPPDSGSMIMNSFRCYVPRTVHDHEQGLADATVEARARVVALAAGGGQSAIMVDAVPEATIGWSRRVHTVSLSILRPR